jgi:hypothetical protein
MTLIFTIPQIWVHIYLGVVGRDALEQKAPNLDLMVTVVTVVVVLCVIALISRRMRIALRDRNGRPVGSLNGKVVDRSEQKV